MLGVSRRLGCSHRYGRYFRLPLAFTSRRASQPGDAVSGQVNKTLSRPRTAANQSIDQNDTMCTCTPYLRSSTTIAWRRPSRSETIWCYVISCGGCLLLNLSPRMSSHNCARFFRNTRTILQVTVVVTIKLWACVYVDMVLSLYKLSNAVI